MPPPNPAPIPKIDDPILSSMYQPAKRKGKDSVFEEDAALIAALLEEDDSWRVAREV